MTQFGTAVALAENMAYLPRYEYVCDNCYFHVTWQCHDNNWLMQWDWAKKLYYNLLLKYKDKYGIEIHAYNFMDNHPHLIGHMHEKEKFSAFFRVVNSQLALAINKQLKRRGQVVMDRFKSPQIESDEHMLTAMAYVDLNQHRVKKVTHPKHNDWSSYGYYAYGKNDPLITPSPSYLGLGRDTQSHCREYRAIVEALIANRKTMNISHTYYIGNPDWVLKKYRELCDKLGRKVTPVMAKKLTGSP